MSREQAALLRVHAVKGAATGLLVGLAGAVFIACASSSPRPASVPAAQTNAGSSTPVPGGDRHAQIEQLSAKLDEQQGSLQTLPAPAPNAPSCGSACEQMAAAEESKDAACHPAKTQSCTDVCTLSDSICDTKDKICNLAADMPGDAWAAGKCTDAQSSCAAAHGRCCSC